ncbi:Inhibitor of vertebrate lysozyme (Ivy) [Flexibacter flexilis DSM 6793]|uniref:Inhibitor of vertebrate lysozyme (Ivy) n=1 Tax=Flexibacter flexilis DSM 6793 TaxID=927664 RepID=A0A1I1E8U7_9BACT|nr:hypothetical protein [Flexibacter flexilis]SFB81420.1 Inhibitor of vertebrate lysozyme (Ivy) [Flexibacter flexilis DSM 6793]
MKKFTQTILISSFIYLFAACANEKTITEQPLSAEKAAEIPAMPHAADPHSERAPAEDLEFLKKLNGKYPYEVKLLNSPQLTTRLQKLMGENYNALKEFWEVEEPIKVDENQFVASACQAHNCDNTNFIIVYNFKENMLYVGVRQEQQVQTYSEDGNTCPTLKKWIGEGNTSE